MTLYAAWWLSYLSRSWKKDFNFLNTRVSYRTCQQGSTYDKRRTLRCRKDNNDDICKMILLPIIYWLSTEKVLCSFWNSTHKGLFNTKPSTDLTSLKVHRPLKPDRHWPAVPVRNNRGQQHWPEWRLTWYVSVMEQSVPVWQQAVPEDRTDKSCLKVAVFSKRFWVDIPLKVLPLLNGVADRNSDPFAEQPRLPTLSTLYGVTSEERLQGGCLVPSHQQLWFRVLKESTNVGCNKEHQCNKSE